MARPPVRTGCFKVQVKCEKTSTSGVFGFHEQGFAVWGPLQRARRPVPAAFAVARVHEFGGRELVVATKAVDEDNSVLVTFVAIDGHLEECDGLTGRGENRGGGCTMQLGNTNPTEARWAHVHHVCLGQEIAVALGVCGGIEIGVFRYDDQPRRPNVEMVGTAERRDGTFES